VKRVLVAMAVLVLQQLGAQAQGRHVVDEMRRMLDTVASVVSVTATAWPHPVALHVSGHSDADWIEGVLRSSLTEQRIALDEASTSKKLMVVPVDVAVRYDTHESADSVRRTIAVDVQISLVDTDGVQQMIPVARLQRTENLLRSSARALESRQRTCTWAEMPEAPTSFWDSILEPAVYVGAAVVATVLFFTVRSQ